MVFAKIQSLRQLLRKRLLWTIVQVLSTGGIGKVSRSTPSFRGLRSTQVLTLPDFLGTTTIPAHQGIGSVTLAITPSSSILSRSSFTLALSGMQRPQLSHKMHESHAFLPCFRKDLTVSRKIYKPTPVYRL